MIIAEVVVQFRALEGFCAPKSVRFGTCNDLANDLNRLLPCVQARFAHSGPQMRILVIVHSLPTTAVISV